MAARIKSKKAANLNGNGRANGFLNIPTKTSVTTSGKPGDAKTKMLASSYTPAYAEQVARMVLAGATEREIIVAFQITRKVLQMWQLQYPEFAVAMMIPKEATLADARVMREIYEQSLPHEEQHVKVVVIEGGIEKVKYNKKVRGNLGAAKFWMANRDRTNWSKDPDNADPNKAVAAGVININNIRGMSTEQLYGIMRVIQTALTPSAGLKRLDVVDATAEPVEVPVSVDPPQET